MISASASTTLNGLKNVSISCSERKTKKQRINGGTQTMLRKGRAVRRTMRTGKAPVLGSNKPEFKHRKVNCIKINLWRTRLQARNGPAAKQLSSSRVCSHGSQRGNWGTFNSTRASFTLACSRAAHGWAEAHRAQCSSVLQSLLRWVHFVSHTSHQK